MHHRFKRATAPIAAALIFCLTVSAQVAQVEKVDLEMMKKIREEGMQRSQVMDTLSWMTDVNGPRLSGSPGMKSANEWTKNKLTEWGLVNGHLEGFEFGRGWSFEHSSAHMTAPYHAPLIAYPKAWTPGTNGMINGEVVLLDIKTADDLEKYRGKLKGAIVFIAQAREVKAQFKPQGERLTDEQLLKMANADAPGGQMGRNMNEDRMRRFREAMELQRKRDEFFRSEAPAVIVEPSRPGKDGLGDGGTVFVQGGGPRDKKAPQAMPSLVMAVEHYNRIVRMIQKGQKVKLEVNIAAKFYDDDTKTYNTVAEIPGTDLKDEVVMLGGHLDSWHAGTGATDNAAGCAVAMEAVRILKTLGVQPRRTIRIALWSGEEQGLIGSRAYVSEHFASRQAPAGAQNDPIAMMRSMNSGPLTIKPEHAKISAYFNLDNGTGKVRGVYLQGNEAVRSIFRAWLAPFRDLGAETLTIQNTGGTDHLSFDGVGIPGFQFIQDEVEYDTRTHHSNMDVWDRVQADDMKQASVIMAAFVYNAAMRDEKLPRKPAPGANQAANR
ncbi:MAG: M20/M25/M40 family metallo-hydrolase [Blastocatellales bacterium]